MNLSYTGKTAYHDFRLLKDDEIKRWVGIYANQHTHMGNRTSGRAEGFHSSLKNALGHQSVAILRLTVKRMHFYYKKMVTDLKSRRVKISLNFCIIKSRGQSVVEK